ncbi:MAG TPA: twin-arginine translocase subunit TatC, partial [Vicingus sp.]|nr:twin-arginine translocase subunit TatC [Vicingus sp.]
MSKSNNNKAEMSFLEHLEVLRWHLVRSSIVVVLFAILIFAFPSFVFDEIILAQKYSNFWTYRVFCDFSEWLGKGDLLCMGDINFELINITMSGQFSMHIMVSLIGGLILAFPYLLFEIWKF